MADVKTVRGTIGGAVVETSEEIAKRLGATFVPEKQKAPAKKSASKKSEK